MVSGKRNLASSCFSVSEVNLPAYDPCISVTERKQRRLWVKAVLGDLLSHRLLLFVGHGIGVWKHCDQWTRKHLDVNNMLPPRLVLLGTQFLGVEL